MNGLSPDRTGPMRRQRQTQSEDKHRAVKTAVDACVARGAADSASGIARAAQVTETFLYRHQSAPCPRCETIFGMGPISYYRNQMARVAESRDAQTQEKARVTPASLQADLANSQAANRRLQQRIHALERRLGQVLGHDVQKSLPSADGDRNGNPDSEQRAEELSQELSAAQATLADREEELEAVRRLTADLMRQLNAEPGGGRATELPGRTPAPPRDEGAIEEAVRLLKILDNTSPRDMTPIFYQHWFEELSAATRDLLRLLGRDVDTQK